MMFEADAEELRASGIRIGADQREFEESLMEEALRPFAIDLRNDALRMTRLYALLYCFENSVRQLVSERLEEAFGANWWSEKVPTKIRSLAESRRSSDQKNNWLEGEKSGLITYIEFGHLADI